MKYVYPVVSRRSGGLSIGLNMSPTARCNFACVYCQVLGELDVKLQSREKFLHEGDRKKDVHRFSPLVDIPRLVEELRELITMVNDGTLFVDGWFSHIPPEKREIKDIAFSGDGEPTLSLQFPEVLRLVAEARRELCPDSTKIVLITNGTTLQNETVRAALRFMLENNGEIWTKLDAGTPEYFELIARSAIPFETILDGLTEASKELPMVVQSCFLSLHDEIPSDNEIRRYAENLRRIVDAGGKIIKVQIYTVARSTPEPWARPLTNPQLDRIVETVRAITALPVQPFYSS